MNFTFANTLDDALVALAAGARPIAGGSDLVVSARHGKAPLPPDVVAIDRLSELARIEIGGDTTRIGAVVSHATIESHPHITEMFPGLADASALVGSPATRHVGTLGGNVMNGSPAMDTGAPLLVLGALVELRSSKGVRAVPISELWTGPGRTVARPDELCTAIVIPTRPRHSSSAYVRLEYRRAMEIAVVGAAASVTLNEDGTIVSLQVALTAVAPTIIPVDGLERFVGKRPGLIGSGVATLAAEQARPISDVRASDRYRRHCVGVMAQRAVEAAARRAGGERIPCPLNRTSGIGSAS